MSEFDDEARGAVLALSHGSRWAALATVDRRGAPAASQVELSVEAMTGLVGSAGRGRFLKRAPRTS